MARAIADGRDSALTGARAQLRTIARDRRHTPQMHVVRMSSRTLYAAVAASLLVSLGLGLIYLVIMERLAFVAALGVLAGSAVAIPALAALADLFEEARAGPRDRGR